MPGMGDSTGLARTTLVMDIAALMPLLSRSGRYDGDAADVSQSGGKAPEPF